MIQGFDYASIDGNKPPDFAKAKANGCSFVIIRGAFTYKGQCLADQHLARDRAPAQAAGLRVGAYMILGWDLNGPSPEQQAQTFIKAYGARRDGELPPWLDLEADSARSIGRTAATALDWAHRAYDVLVAFYSVVGVYTSARVWSDVFGDLPSRMGDGPLWLKVPYPYKAGQPLHPEDVPELGTLPMPWRVASSPGTWIEQYQGDAKGVSGFSSTVDGNVFLTRGSCPANWLARANVTTVAQFQHARGLMADGVVGPTTFSALAR